MPERRTVKRLFAASTKQDLSIFDRYERLNHAMVSYNQKHPIIIDKNHVLRTLIITQEHRRSLHMEQQSMLSNLREKFWFLGGISTIKCIKCVSFVLELNPGY